MTEIRGTGGPAHVQIGERGRCTSRKARYTTATGYKLKGTVGPTGRLEMHIVAPPNASNPGSAPIDIVVNGTIDGSSTVRARQISHPCSYDFVWQK